MSGNQQPIVIEEKEVATVDPAAIGENSDKVAPPEPPKSGGLIPSIGAVILGGIVFLIMLNLEALAHEWMTRWAVLGWILQILLALMALGIIIALLREISALRRLKRNAQLRSTLEQCTTAQVAISALRPILRTYQTGKRRDQLNWEQYQSAVKDALDPQDVMLAFERDILSPLDQEAQKIIEQSARRVAALTTLVPHPAVDILMVSWINLRMIRKLSETYAGRSGFLSNLRLLRWTAAHFLAAGAIELSDEALGAIVGGSALSKLSRRFGEGAINAALTTRIGLLAQQDCRPAPFVHQEQASLRASLTQAVAGLFSTQTPKKDPK